ncbi:MAG: Ig-like domain-containing protein [Prevotella sp.]|nr:Ig-like domain-containing protein [Prevotella sp.]
MAKKNEKRYGTCQNPECMNYGISDVIPDDGNCPVCHSPMKPEEESIGNDGFDLNDTDDFSIGGGTRKTGKSGGPNIKTIGIIAATVLFVAGIGFALWKFVFDTQEIAKIKLKPKKVTLVIGGNPREVIKATVVDKKGTIIKDAKVTFKWSVADDKIATVTQGGEVTAVKKGNTTITVKVEGLAKRAICKVEVKEANDSTPNSGGGSGKEDDVVYIKQLSIKDTKDFTLAPGATKTLSYIDLPKDNDEEPEWESSNPAVATVDEDGVVKAVGEGSATITVKATNVSASVNVTVKKQGTTSTSTGGSGTSASGGAGKVNLGYGVYEGPTKGGKAHGIGGQIRFTRSYSIDLKKASGETVDVYSGDRMINVKMDNNRLIQGLLKRSDGSQRWIIIG